MDIPPGELAGLVIALLCVGGFTLCSIGLCFYACYKPKQPLTT